MPILFQFSLLESRRNFSRMGEMSSSGERYNSVGTFLDKYSWGGMCKRSKVNDIKERNKKKQAGNGLL